MAGRLVHFSQNWENFKTSSFHMFLTEDQDILSVVKEYVRSFLKVPMRGTIREQVAIYWRIGIVNRSRYYGNAGQRDHRKVEYHILGLFLSNNLLVKKKEMHKVKSIQQVYSMQAFQNRRVALPEIPSTQNPFLCKVDVKDVYS